MIISNRPNQLQSFYSVRTSAGHVRHSRDASTFGIQATLGCGLGTYCTLVRPRTCQALWRHVYTNTVSASLLWYTGGIPRRSTTGIVSRGCFQRLVPCARMFWWPVDRFPVLARNGMRIVWKETKLGSCRRRARQEVCRESISWIVVRRPTIVDEFFREQNAFPV